MLTLVLTGTIVIAMAIMIPTLMAPEHTYYHAKQKSDDLLVQFWYMVMTAMCFVLPDLIPHP